MTGTHSHDVRFLGVALACEGRAHGPLLGGPQRLEDRELPPGRILGPLRLIETVVERLPSGVAAANCVKPKVLPVWPSIVPHRLR
jgi:hypothetical protein